MWSIDTFFGMVIDRNKGNMYYNGCGDWTEVVVLVLLVLLLVLLLFLFKIIIVTRPC